MVYIYNPKLSILQREKKLGQGEIRIPVEFECVSGRSGLHEQQQTV